ncbi:LacI family DNA-binding transcriptional regulator [Actinopolymorpha sp. B17G11]|uniref:LacI family DNA-binding transcriptional regulator n=1 Tax=Actinopolymorpha sp. B17G11 TaxID=3160861 RepID=UPI0032E489C8
MPGRQHPTSRDVAELAGVSIATVSYVMNGRDDRRVSAQTRDRVLAAAQQLAYAPNQSARSLRRRRTERVVLVVGSIGVPAYDELAIDLHASADDAGYGVITLVVDTPARALKAVDLLRQRIADGAVIASSVPHMQEDTLASLARAGLPLVVMSNSVRPDGFDVVRAPERQACGDALDHLFRSGRRRIAFVGHAHEVAAEEASERRTAYVDALERHGVPAREQIIVPGANSRVAGYRAVTDLLARPDRPDAIFAASDRAAISAIRATVDAGLAVPEDVAVIGVGNLEEGVVTRPALSTVGPAAQDYAEVARLLFDRVLRDTPLPGRERLTPWSFIRRGSA